MYRVEVVMRPPPPHEKSGRHNNVSAPQICTVSLLQEKGEGGEGGFTLTNSQQQLSINYLQCGV